MQKKGLDKKVFYFEKKIQDVLVCRKNSFKPYLEVFIQDPENIMQENLGTLAGILEITDNSEDSSYIVNYLVSILKKEYYCKIKKEVLESFEAALHKINLALAKLAEHKNTGWVGKLNAAIMVVEKNNLHLAMAGNAKIFLSRAEALTDISKSYAGEETPNPLKTFTEVISGRLEDNDKIIVATNNIFDILSFEEIRKNAFNFSFPDFVQFLKTALGNELERAAALAVKIEEKVKEISTVEKKEEFFNAFSQATFLRNKEPEVLPSEKTGIQEGKYLEEIQNDLKKEKGGFVDKKTGHIYIKENNQTIKIKELWWPPVKENIRIKFVVFINKLQTIVAMLTNFFLKQSIGVWKKIIAAKNKWKENRKKEQTISELMEEKADFYLKDKPEKIFYPKTDNFPQSTGKKFFQRIINNLEVLFANIFSKIRMFFSGIFPRFSRMKNIFGGLSRRQKFFAVLAVVLILLIPYFIAKKQKNNATKENSLAESQIASPFLLENDLRINKVSNLEEIYSGKEKLTDMINLNGKLFAFYPIGIIDIESKKSFPFPDSFIPVKLATGMDDLNLIFILNEKNSVLAWSPANGKFQENQIIISGNASFISAGFLTYFYVLDSQNNQIYRYPRAEGGFGASVAWLKENINLSEINDLAVSDNIYLAENNNIIKLYRGKKQDFKIEKTATAITANKIYTQENYQYIYILDKTNSRIIKTDLNGQIIAQYYNEKISNADDFTIDEKNLTVYLLFESNVKKFKIE